MNHNSGNNLKNVSKTPQQEYSVYHKKPKSA